jgi:hypothetical protein
MMAWVAACGALVWLPGAMPAAEVEHEMPTDERKPWNGVKQLVDTYALDPEIRTLEVQQHDRAEAGKAIS